MTSADEPLERRHRQVLGFLATYLAEQDCLPSTAEVAVGCGIRSPNTARRIMRELEDQGLLRRDPRFPRLGTVTLEVASPDRDIERFITEMSIMESNGNLSALRKGLAWAPDLGAVEFLHREGSSRVTFYRAYLEVRRRLVEAGATLPELARDQLASLPERIEVRHRLFDDWTSYCLYSTAMSVGSRLVMHATADLRVGHLEPILVAESTFYAIGSRIDYLETVAELERDEQRVTDLFVAVCDDLNVAVLAAHDLYPRLVEPLEPFTAERMLAAVRAIDPGVRGRERSA